MCGRYTDPKRKKEFLVRMGINADLDFTPHYNIAPTHDARIVAQREDGSLELRLVHWELIPYQPKHCQRTFHRLV